MLKEVTVSYQMIDQSLSLWELTASIEDIGQRYSKFTCEDSVSLFELRQHLAVLV